MALNEIREMRTIFAVVSLLTVPVVAAAEPIGWQKYAISETGANVDLPLT